MRPGDVDGSRLNRCQWRQAAVHALAEEMRLAEMLGAHESLKASVWRSLLIVGLEWEGSSGEE